MAKKAEPVPEHLAHTCVLGNFVPSSWKLRAITQELTAWIEAQGLTVPNAYGLDVRNPTRNRVTQCSLPSGGSGLDWHRDCSGVDQFLLLWSNLPTEVRSNAGPALRVAPCDVLWVNNRESLHRAPPWYESDLPRWFARVRYTPKTLQPKG